MIIILLFLSVLCNIYLCCVLIEEQREYLQEISAQKLQLERKEKEIVNLNKKIEVLKINMDDMVNRGV